MTADERIEALGVDLSDLPRQTKTDYAYAEKDAIRAAIYAAMRFQGEDPITFPGETTVPCYVVDYILHLTDVIDRMEMALENVCGEREYLLRIIKKHKDGTPVQDCKICKSYFDNLRCGEDCDEGSSETDHFEFGVPEDWRADDDQL